MNSVDFKVSKKQKELLKHVCNNNLKCIEDLISRDKDLLAVKYHTYGNRNILILACDDVDISKKLSTRKVKGETITKLIDLGASYTEPSEPDRWATIHYVASNGNKDKLSAIVKYLTVEEANDVVHYSKPLRTEFPKSGFPKSSSNNALHLLLKHGRKSEEFRTCCQILITAGVSVNQQDSTGVTPLHLLKVDENCRDLVLLAESQVLKTKVAFNFAQTGSVKEFLSQDFTKEELDDVDGPSEEKSNFTLLQFCCKEGLTKYVEHIVEKGVSPNRTIRKNPDTPLMIAIEEDHEDVVRLWLDNENFELPEDILIQLQIKKSFTKMDKYMTLLLDHIQSFEPLKRRKFLIATDKVNRIPLHYAIQFHHPEIVLKLLSMGSPLTKKDVFGCSPLHSIEPNLLEQFLDSCIVLSKDMKDKLYDFDNSKRKISLEINYEALTSETSDSEPEREECEALILKKHGSKAIESEFLYQIFHTPNLSQFVSHPVISSYLEMKWHKFKYTVYSNFLLYLLGYVFLLGYGFELKKSSRVIYVVLSLAFAIIIVRQLVQFLIFRLRYFKRLENYIDLFLICGILYIIAAAWIAKLSNYNLKVAYSVTFLTSTLGFFMQVGKLPFFAIKVIILKQTTISFFKCMLYYTFPILAFFFCFYMLNESEDDLFYQTLYDVMITFAGEADRSYPERFKTNPIFGHIIYLCFVIFIGVILQNLLIGLTVSDMQKIHEHAEYLGKKERADYITSMENIIFLNINSSSSLFRKVFKKLLKAARIFNEEMVLVVRPYNNGCVYPKGKNARKEFIKDEGVIIVLRRILKNLMMDEAKESDAAKDKEIRLKRIENLLESVLEQLSFSSKRKSC